MTLLSRRSGAIDGAALCPYQRLSERKAIAQMGYPDCGLLPSIGDRTKKGDDPKVAALEPN
jgi:hypothetical protein